MKTEITIDGPVVIIPVREYDRMAARDKCIDRMVEEYIENMSKLVNSVFEDTESLTQLNINGGFHTSFYRGVWEDIERKHISNYRDPEPLEKEMD